MREMSHALGTYFCPIVVSTDVMKTIIISDLQGNDSFTLHIQVTDHSPPLRKIKAETQADWDLYTGTGTEIAEEHLSLTFFK